MQETLTDIEKLREIALDQHGYVTASQADQIGVSRPSLSYLTKNERIERVQRGIYRIPQVPATRYDALHLALLWTNAAEAALSHDTALDAWRVCDINPVKIHVTIAKDRRINKAGGENCVVHKHDILPNQVTWWEQMPTVNLSTAIEQCISRGVSSHVLLQALENGQAQRMLTKREARSLSEKLKARHEP